MLIFVTGQQEVNVLVRRLRAAFPLTGLNEASDDEGETSKKKKKKSRHRPAAVSLPDIDLDK